MKPIKRIAIVGCAGSGKSTLARLLGQLTGIEVIHLDRHFWHLGWEMTPRDEWVQIQKQLLQKDSWIIDGNYGSTLEIRLERADTVIWFDFPRWLCLFRVAKRRLRYIRRQSRPDMAEGCPEKLDWEFIRWIWNFPRIDGVELREKLSRPRCGLNIVRFTSPGELKAWFNQVKEQKGVVNNENGHY